MRGEQHYYVVILEPIGDQSEVAKHRAEHLAYLEEQRRRGKLIVGGRFTDGSGGMYILLVSDRSEAEEIANNDPYCRLGFRVPKIKEWERTF